MTRINTMRNEQVLTMFKEGVHKEEIARRLNLTRGTVAGIVNRAGLSTAQIPVKKADVSTLYSLNLTHKEIAAKVGVTPSRVRQIVTDIIPPEKKRHKRTLAEKMIGEKPKKPRASDVVSIIAKAIPVPPQPVCHDDPFARIKLDGNGKITVKENANTGIPDECGLNLPHKNGCKWEVNSGKSLAFQKKNPVYRFCNAPLMPGKSYCPEHYLLSLGESARKKLLKGNGF